MLVFPRELRFGDCDPSGIAYFPSYLNMLNGVVEDFWREMGFAWPKLIGEMGIGTPTAHISCDFSRPSFYGDTLTFKVAVRRVGAKSLHLDHGVFGLDGLRWKATQVIVATSIGGHKSVAWPGDIRLALESHVTAEPLEPEPKEPAVQAARA
ncbi:MAG: acyl-CoA thioesterase [Proteobacteria bacterium]|nr:acyl-CoA thioesterase [Pseudomonadota bacterium]